MRIFEIIFEFTASVITSSFFKDQTDAEKQNQVSVASYHSSYTQYNEMNVTVS